MGWKIRAKGPAAVAGFSLTPSGAAREVEPDRLAHLLRQALAGLVSQRPQLPVLGLFQLDLSADDTSDSRTMMLRQASPSEVRGRRVPADAPPAVILPSSCADPPIILR